MNKKFLKIFLISTIVLIIPFFIKAEELNEVIEEKITLTYYCNGGKNCPQQLEIEKPGATINVSSIVPNKKNYTFVGWDTDSAGKTVVYNGNDEIEVTDNVNLYAVYGKKITVSLNANGGKVSKKKITIWGKKNYPSIVTPKRKGYRFLGWFSAKSGGNLINPNTTVNNEKNHTIYAHWEKINYTINYVLNGGNISNERKNYNVTTKTFKLKSPTRTGYIFKGWYTTNKYKKKVTTIKKGTVGDKTYYAKWSAIKYNIKYVGNGSTKGKTKTAKNIGYDKNYTLKNNWFSKKGYTFKGWSTTKNGTGTIFKGSEIVKKLSSKNKKTVTLYAQWSLTDYNINYELNGGDNNSLNPNTYTFKSGDIILENPTKFEATFEGWYKDSNYSKTVTKIAKGSTGNITVYAKWKEIPKCTFETIHSDWNWQVRLSNSNTIIDPRQFFSNYSDSNCYITYNSTGESIDLVTNNSNTFIKTNIIGKSELNICINRKITNEQLDCVKKNIDVVYEYGNELTVRDTNNFLNSISGYYWYLDNSVDPYAYLYPTVMDWYDHKLLNWDSENIKLENNKFIVSGETNEKYLNDTEIHNTFLENPVEYSYFLIEKYNMHVSNDKLFITLGNTTYSFSKSLSKKEIVVSYNFNKTSFEVNEGETFEIIIDYTPVYEGHYFEFSIPYKDYTFSSGSGGFLPATCHQSEDTTTGRFKFTCEAVSNSHYLHHISPYVETTMTISEPRTGKSWSIPLRVNVIPINVESITLSEHEKEMLRGESAKLEYTLSPNNPDNTNVSWTSSDNNIATVDNKGNVKALSKGTVNITVTTEDGSYSDTCEITIENPPLTATASIGMSIVSTGSGTYRGISVEINPKGGTGQYTYYSISLYRSDGELLGTVNEREMFTTYSNGSYYAEYEVHDSEGNEYSGTTTVTTISGF